MDNLKLDGMIVLIALGVIIAPNVGVLGTGSSAYLVMDQDQPSRRCKYSKAYSMLQVDCTKRDFDKIPSTLNTDIEVMVMTLNRIRELPKDSFTPYGSLAYLYLGDNFITNINHSIENIKYLQVLDVSTNGILVIPPALLQLPYLRKLYLSDNLLTDDSFELEVNSPLEYIDVAKNKLKKIPSIGSQPVLTFFNLSSNHIARVSAEDIAPFCSLKTLDLSVNPIQFDSSKCDCHHFNSWIKMRNISVKPHYFCNKDTLSSCDKIGFSNKTMESFERCLHVIEIQEATAKARSTWIIVACCIGAFLISVTIGLYCIHKRNKKRGEEQENEQRLAVHNAKMELLNGNLPEQENSKS